jgi:16S rRNA processing protein RimM
VINEILKTPQQLLASLTYQGHEVLIPLAEALITGINVARKEIEMSLPEGLIDLYLE